VIRAKRKKIETSAADSSAGTSAELGLPAAGGFDTVQALPNGRALPTVRDFGQAGLPATALAFAGTSGLVAVIASLVAAWIAAGSTGLLAHPLRRALTLVALGVAVFAQRSACRMQDTGPKTQDLMDDGRRTMDEGSSSLVLRLSSLVWRAGLAVVAAVVLATFMIASSLPVANVMGVSLVLAALAFECSGNARRMLYVSSLATVVFGLYRMAFTCIPLVWSTADFLGRALGNAAGLVTHQSMYLGATFAGLDFLVLMSVLWVLWLARSSPRPRLMRAVYGFLAILGGHLCYLIVLSYTPQLLAAVADPAKAGLMMAGAAGRAEQEGWHWAGLLYKAVPWNIPVLACGIHLLTAAAMFRWSALLPESERTFTDASTRSCRTLNPRHKTQDTRPKTQDSRLKWSGIWSLGSGVWCLVSGLAVLLPIIVALYPAKSTLQGKKIVFYEKGFLNWLKPEHGSYGRLSSGMYGMLPAYIESFGASSLISADLSDEDLRDADVLVLLFPDEGWAEGQLARIWDFVDRGGSLLVMGEHTTRDRNRSNRFNEVLEPTAIRVQFDSATFAVGGWLQSYEAIAHPATAGVSDDRNQFGVVIGASLETGWPARPLLIGRWGWADIGDEGSGQAMMGNGKYDPGEKLGDLILAAEQPMGKGRIIAFGDTSSLTNGINVSSHIFTSRLFGYLAGDFGDAHPIWRQLLGILGCGLLIGLLIWHPGQWTPAASLLRSKTAGAVALCVAGSLAVSTAISQSAGEVLPDGRYKSPNNLAYIDSSHIEAYSGESWRPDGLGGLALTLMRDGYLALSLPQFTAERIQRACLLISIAPSRAFSKAELTAVRDFVTNGGTFIIMVGLQEAAPSRSLLSLFGFTIGASGPGTPEPQAMGHFKSPYLRSGDQRVYVRFHAAWPITCNPALIGNTPEQILSSKDEPISAGQAQVIVYGQNNLPVIILRRLGAGKVVVIGDTCFAMDKNLEREGGEPFEGLRENADFWRWFITRLRDQEMWVPPALQSQPAVHPGEASQAAERPAGKPESEKNTPLPDKSNQEVAD